MARSHDIRQKWHRVQNERFLPQKENSTKSFRLYPSPFCFLTAPPFLRKCRSSTDKTSAFNLHFRLLNENRLQLIHDQAFKNLKKLEILYVYIIGITGIIRALLKEQMIQAIQPHFFRMNLYSLPRKGHTVHGGVHGFEV